MEFKSVSDWRAGPGLCRCCLSDGCYKDISNEYFWKGDKEVYADMLLDCFDLTISYQECGPNSNSRLICEVCIQRLRDAFSFKKQVVSSERRFSDYVKALASGEKPDLASFHEVKVELIKGEKAPSEPAEDDDMHNDLFDNLDDDDDDDADNQPLKNFASQLPKVESDTMQDIPAFDEDLIKKEAKVVKRKYTKKATSTSSKKAKPTTDDPEASSSKIKMDKKKGRAEETVIKTEVIEAERLLLELTDNKEYTRSKYKKSTKAIARASIKQNATLIIELSTVCPFKWFRNNFVCAYCDKNFPDCDPLRKHVSQCRSEPSVVEIYRRMKELAPINIDVTNALCRICLEPFVDVENFMIHVKNEHEKNLNDLHPDGVVPFNLNGDCWKCVKCEAVFNNFLKLYEHMNKHYQYYICDTCGKGFMSAPRLRKHSESHATGTFPCGICDRIFNMRAARERHKISAHTKGPRYQCPRCELRFERYYDRMSHLSEMHFEKAVEYKCVHCEMSFRTSGGRSIHVRTLHFPQERIYGCSECEWHFKTPYELKRHKVRHSTERNFHCRVCGKSYSRNKTLREHMRVHSNDKSFTCDVCGQSFLQKCSLKQHARAHHPEKALSLLLGAKKTNENIFAPFSGDGLRMNNLGDVKTISTMP